MKTYSPKASEIERQWWVIDATGKTLGRLAAEVVQLLRGKHKPIYSPHFDVGDFVVVVNASKVKVSGKKRGKKIYYWHSHYPGGLRSATFSQKMSQNPCWVIEHAVKGMLPHNPLGRAMARRLKVYPSDSHPHQAQIKSEGALIGGKNLLLQHR